MAKLEPVPQSGYEIQEYTVDSAATFTKGAFVLLASDEEIEECGADPADVLGIALHDAGDGIPSTKVLVAKAMSSKSKFWMSTSDGTAALSNVNTAYGVVKTSGIWLVDLTDTTNDVVYVHDYDEDRGLLLVSIVEAARQVAP